MSLWPSLIIAHSKTHLYIRVTWARELFRDAPCLKHCWKMNENGWKVTVFPCSKFKSLNFFLVYFKVCSFVPRLCHFLTTSQLNSPGFLFRLPMCICGTCTNRQNIQGITQSVAVNTYLFIRIWLVGRGNATCWIQCGSFSLWQHPSVCLSLRETLERCRSNIFFWDTSWDWERKKKATQSASSVKTASCETLSNAASFLLVERSSI